MLTISTYVNNFQLNLNIHRIGKGTNQLLHQSQLLIIGVRHYKLLIFKILAILIEICSHWSGLS